MSHSDNTCPQSGSDTSHLTDKDKAPRPSISNDIWIMSSIICQLNQLFSNSEAAMLSSRIAQTTHMHKTRTFEGRVYNLRYATIYSRMIKRENAAT